MKEPSWTEIIRWTILSGASAVLWQIGAQAVAIKTL